MRGSVHQVDVVEVQALGTCVTPAHGVVGIGAQPDDPPCFHVSEEPTGRLADPADRARYPPACLRWASSSAFAICLCFWLTVIADTLNSLAASC